MIQYMVTSLVLHSEVHTYEITYMYDLIYIQNWKHTYSKIIIQIGRINRPKNHGLHRIKLYQVENLTLIRNVLMTSHKDGACLRD